MSVKLEDKGNSLVELSTSVSGKEFEEAKEKAFRKLASKIQIKGFRKGQAPLEMVKNRISQYEIINEAINLSLNDAYNAALREAKIRPFNSPEVDVTRVDDKGYDVTFKFTKYPEVKLGKYKGLKTKLETAKVTAKDVDESIEKLLKENASLELKDGPAAMGDTVVFDFKGYIDGKEFEGGSADNYSLVLGSQQFIPGFEEQLVGVTAESKKDVLVTFPEQYVKNLAGKDAKFVCMVHEVKANVTPKLDEEFVEMLAIDGVKTVEDLKKHQKEALKTEKENEAVKKQFDELVKTIIDNAEVEIGDAVLKNEADGLKENLINQIKQNGLTYEQYKEITASTDESIEAQFMAQAKENLKGYLVISEIGRAENLVITKADVDNYYNQIAKTYNMKVEDVKKAYGNDDSRVANQLMNSKIYEFIRLNNNVDEEAEAKKEEPKAEEKPAKKPAAKKAAAPKTEEKKPAAKKATKTKKAE